MTKKRNTTNQPNPLTMATLLIALGLIGLWWAMQPAQNGSSFTDPNRLQVVEGQKVQTNQSNGQAASRLQSAARVRDFINGKEGDEVQSGSSVDSLLKDKQINQQK